MLRFYASGYASCDEIGIRECTIDPQTAKCEIVSEFSSLTNPSYVLCHPHKRVLYAVEELTPEGRVVALSTAGGSLRRLCAFPSRGADPCHLSLSPDARFLFVSNYTSGSLTVFRLDEDGVPAEVSDFVQHEMDGTRGKGGIPSRQECAHVHFSHCDGKQVFVNDLGLNAVLVYGWDAAHGKLIDRGEIIQFPDGSGPRHLAFSGDSRFLYVLCELNARVHVFERSGSGSWQRLQEISSVPEDFQAFSEFNYSVAAAIRLVDDRTLCASNRGHDSLALFRIAPDGSLRDRRVICSEGKTPRDFQAIGDCLVVANQDSGNLSVFACGDEEAYSLRGQILKAGKPSCICAIPEKW